MSVTKKYFGDMPDGTQIFEYTIDNGKGLKADIINYGGIVRRLFAGDVDVVLGRDTLSEYFNNSGCFGAAIGRYANRIYRGKFSIDGKEYSVGINNGKNSLHGGVRGFDKYVYSVKELDDGVELSAVSPDGDEGFPGELRFSVTYTVTDQNALAIHYKAVSDKDTVVNLTNHSYFNLNGAGNGDVHSHELQMNCRFYTPNTDECLPYGEILSVKDTPFDFTEGKKVGRDIDSDAEQIQMFMGYDHNFIIDGIGFRKAAEVRGDESGITMEVYTDKPGVQLYTGNHIDETRVCKDGKKYKKHGGLCLETQFFPNSTSFSHFSSPLLRAGDVYDFTTEYRFILK